MEKIPYRTMFKDDTTGNIVVTTEQVMDPSAVISIENQLKARREILLGDLQRLDVQLQQIQELRNNGLI